MHSTEPSRNRTTAVVQLLDGYAAAPVILPEQRASYEVELDITLEQDDPDGKFKVRFVSSCLFSSAILFKIRECEGLRRGWTPSPKPSTRTSWPCVDGHLVRTGAEAVRSASYEMELLHWKRTKTIRTASSGPPSPMKGGGVINLKTLVPAGWDPRLLVAWPGGWFSLACAVVPRPRARSGW